METFHKRYRDECKMESTSEIVLNHASVRILAKAMEHAQSVDDLQAINAAHNESPPMETEESLVAYTGIDGTRKLIPASFQYTENGESADAIAGIWWRQDEDEFTK